MIDFEVVKRIYPDYKIVGVEEMLVEGCPKYFSTLIDDIEVIKTIVRRGTDGIGRKIRVLCLRLRSNIDNNIVCADFNLKELKGGEYNVRET